MLFFFFGRKNVSLKSFIIKRLPVTRETDAASCLVLLIALERWKYIPVQC